MAPRSDRSVISQRLTRTRTRTRTRTGVSWMGSDVLCKVLRRFGLLQRSAGITMGSDGVGMRRQAHGHPPEASFLSFLKKSGNHRAMMGLRLSTSGNSELATGDSFHGERRVGAPCRPTPTRPARSLLSGSPSPSQGAWLGPCPAHSSGWGGGRILMVRTDRQDGETYQIVPKRGKSLFAFQEGLPYARGGLPMTKLDTELCVLFC